MIEMELWGLFTSALLAATLLPGGSEVVLAYLDHRAAHPAWVLLLVAAAGNSLGGMSSWLIGRMLPPERLERPGLRRALERLRRWGSPVLLVSWVPIIGDPLCVAAGWLRVHWGLSAAFIAIGKTARYAVVLLVV